MNVFRLLHLKVKLKDAAVFRINLKYFRVHVNIVKYGNKQRLDRNTSNDLNHSCLNKRKLNIPHVNTSLCRMAHRDYLH